MTLLDLLKPHKYTAKELLGGDFLSPSEKELFSYVFFHVHDPESVKKYLGLLSDAVKLHGDAKSLTVTKIYSEIEKYIVSGKEPDSKAWTLQSFRASVTENIREEFLPTRLAIFFSNDENWKEFAIYEVFLAPLIAYLINGIGYSVVQNSMAGNQSTSSIAEYLRPGYLSLSKLSNDLSLDTDGKLRSTYFIQVKGLFEYLKKEIVDLFGEEIFENLLNESYDDVRAVYDLEHVGNIFKILPEKYFETDRVKVLTRNELESAVLQKTKDLRAEKASIQKQVDDRTSQLKREKFKLSVMTDNMNFGGILLNSELELLHINMVARRVLGIGESEMRSSVVLESFTNFFPAVNIKDQYKSCCNENNSMTMPETAVGGKYYKITFTRALAKFEKDESLFLVSFEDVTAVVQIEKQREQFVSLVTHQLRTPLSAVKWILNMMITGDFGQIQTEQRAYLMKAQESNERMIMLVDDILSSNKVDPAKYQYNKVLIQLYDLFDNVVYELLPIVKKKSIQIKYLSKNHDIPRVLIDPVRMRSVIQNLLENAIKYTNEHGHVTVNIVHKESTVEVAISDSGVGIPADQQKNIFKQFFRASNTKTEGSGLGLYIAKSVVEHHNGKIWFESKEGVGSTFYFSLPVPDPKELLVA